MTQADLIALAKSIAKQQLLDPALICAVCEQESSWNPWSIRYEPAFYEHYIAPNLYPNGRGWNILPTEATARATSWGLMQLMGESAREEGYSLSSLAQLCDPGTGIEWGCKHFSGRLAAAGGDVNKALLLWNGGSNLNYPAQVMARTEKYAAAPAVAIDTSLTAE